MPEQTVIIAPKTARQLAVSKQRLAGPSATPDANGILDVVRDIGCLQLDPTNAVARSHLLVLWSRLGNYDRAELDRLLWVDRSMFEYWAHAASIVLSEDFPIHQYSMRPYASSQTNGGRRVAEWMERNSKLRDHIMQELAERGPLLSKSIEDKSTVSWSSTGWTGGKSVTRMIDFLFIEGTILVAGRSGSGRLWDLPERVLPQWAGSERLPEHEVVTRAAQKSLQALGVATAKQIIQHFTRDSYPNLGAVLNELLAERRIVRAQISQDGRVWPGDWYIHAEDLPLLGRLEAGDFIGRTTLLSPFDNLIADRQRTRLMFDFDFRLEIYVPKAERRHGYFVLPILHGDRLIGRVSPMMDYKRGVLNIEAIYLEPGTEASAETKAAIERAIAELGEFLGAREITGLVVAVA